MASSGDWPADQNDLLKPDDKNNNGVTAMKSRFPD